MDLIPVCAPNRHMLQVPYLLDESHPYVYDNGAFHDFPERMGWNKRNDLFAVNSGRAGTDDEKTPQRAASLTQAWLFFGIIHFVTGIEVVTKDFVTKNTDGVQIVTLQPLLRVIESWHSRMRGPESSQKATRDNFYTVEARLEAIGTLFTICIGVRRSVVPSEVSLSIVLLFKVLMLAKKSIFVNSTIPREHHFGNWDELLKRRLIKNGWCKGDVNRLGDRLSSVHMFCLIAMGRHESTRDHEKCDEHNCRGLIHSMRHAKPDCHCDVVGPKEEELIHGMVEQDLLPLLTFSKEGHLNIQATTDQDMRPPQPLVPYVAISHLCADGLGDPDCNVAFRCQLQRLQLKVNEVKSQLLEVGSLLHDIDYMPFWLDTICVPGKPGPVKSRAISRMKSIYEGATAVLVIDRDLESVKSFSSRLERTLLIATSLWWTRLWTLQEGLFARNLFFQFADRSLTLQSIASSRDEDEPLRKEMYVFGPGWIKRLLTGDLIRSLKFDSLSEASLRETEGRALFERMGYRFASRMEDETVCLAILLSKDAEALAASAPNSEERMKKFILMQKHFPAFLLFDGDIGEKIDHDGFRWAPRTLLGRRALMAPSSTTRHVNEIGPDNRSYDRSWADEEGIHVECPALIFDAEIAMMLSDSPHNPLRALDRDSNRYWDLWCVPNPAGSHSIVGSKPNPLAVVLPRPPTMRGGRSSVMKGRLVRINRKEGEKMFARLAPEVVVMLVIRGECENPNKRDFKDALSVSVREVSENQKWCIG